MPRGKAYSSFNINGEGSPLPKTSLKEYADSTAFDLKKFFFLILGSKKKARLQDRN